MALVPTFDPASYEGQDRLQHIEKHVTFHAKAINGVYNVVNGFGADNTGATDITSALQAANDAASAAGGGGIYAPTGTYLQKGTVYFSNNVTLFGDGMGQTVFKISPDVAGSPGVAYGNGNVWTATTANVTLRDFTVDRSSNTAQHAFNLNGIDNWVFERVEVTGAGQASVASGAVAISGVMPASYVSPLLLSKNVRVIDCKFKRTNNFGVQFSFIEGGLVTGCTFDDCYREAVGIEPSVSCTSSDVSVVGNTITSGTVDTGSATGVVVVTTSSGGTVDGVTIAGNSLRNTNTVASNTNPGINVLGGTDVTITGNSIVGMNGIGISVGSASIATFSVLIGGNTIKNCNAGNNTTFSGPGIGLRQAVQCVLTGNYVKGVHHTASVFESSSASRNLIANNALLDAVDVTFLAGSHSVLGQNTDNRAASSSRIPTATNYTVIGNEDVVAVTDTSVARTITLPAANAVSEGKTIAFKDEFGSAGTSNITINRAGSDTIDSVTSLVINTNFGKTSIYSDGVSKWFTR